VCASVCVDVFVCVCVCVCVCVSVCERGAHVCMHTWLRTHACTKRFKSLGRSHRSSVKEVSR